METALNRAFRYLQDACDIVYLQLLGVEHEHNILELVRQTTYLQTDRLIPFSFIDLVIHGFVICCNIIYLFRQILINDRDLVLTPDIWPES